MNPVHERGPWTRSMDPVHGGGPWTSGPCFVLSPFNGRFNYCLSLDATIMVSKYCPIIGEHLVTIFVTH